MLHDELPELVVAKRSVPEAVRAKGLLKRQRAAGTVVDGAAATTSASAKSKKRGLPITAASSSVGQPGNPYYRSAKLPPVPTSLPVGVTAEVSAVDDEAQAAVIAYHEARCCWGGQFAADQEDWKQPQQKLVDRGQPTATHTVSLRRDSSLVGLIAARVCPERGGATILVIHVVPCERGTHRFPEHLWRILRPLLVQALQLTGRRNMTCVLNMSCDRAPSAAAFWINRCGWLGSTAAVAAAQRWNSGTVAASLVLPDPNSYSISIDLKEHV